MMARLLADVRGGLRSLIKHAGFSSVAVLTLALGVGVSGAVFSVVNGALLNPTPWDHAERVSFVWDRSRDQENALRPLSYARYLDLREQSRTFAGLGAARGFTFVVSEGERADALPGAYVSPELFDILGVDVALGRPLRAEDADPSAPRTLVLDHPTWRTRYAADPDIIGRQLTIDGAPWTVVGVLERDDWFPNPGSAILTALRPSAEELRDRELRNVLVVGRVAQGVQPARVETELGLITQRLAGTHPATDGEEWPLHAQSVSEAMFGGPARIGILALAGALGFLLLIACANLTGLFLTRAVARQREIAVRTAVGGSRGQIVTQLLAENLILALVAIPVALLVTRLTLSFVYAQVPAEVRNLEQVFRFDPPVWIFAGGAALLTVLVFGLTPALHGTRLDLASALKEGGDRGSSGGGSQRLRSVLAVGQLALSVVMLVGASLLGQSFFKLVNAQPGFEMENLFYAPVGLPEARYAEPGQRTDFVARLLERLERIPGIEHVGLSDSAVSAPGGPTRIYEIASKRGALGDDLPETRWTAGTPGYLRAMGLELLAGRYLAEQDDARARRVAVVSELFARTSFASGEDPIGERIVLSDGGEVEIVGVVQNVKQIGMNVTQRPQVYVPYAQQPSSFFQLVARTRVEPLSVGPSVRAVFQELDPLIPILRLTTGLRERALSVWPIGLFASILTLLGGVGLAMASVGIYSVIRYATQQRTREFGIRAALGAEPASLVGLVMRHTGLLTGIGLALGLGLSLALGRVLGALLYEVDPLQPASLLGPAALLALSALVAGALPALQVARVNPTLALGAD